MGKYSIFLTPYFLNLGIEFVTKDNSSFWFEIIAKQTKRQKILNLMRNLI